MDEGGAVQNEREERTKGRNLLPKMRATSSSMPKKLKSETPVSSTNLAVSRKPTHTNSNGL